MLNKALRLIRIFHDLTQKELAEQLEISRSHLSEIEAGRKTPSYELLQRYATVFDVPLSHLLLFSEYLEDDSARNFVASKIISMMDFVANKSGKANVG